MKFKILFIILGVFLNSCSDIFEENIEDEKINILAPADGDESDVYTQTFWWDQLDGALTYNLQVVSPSFSAVEEIVLDTNVSTNKIIYSLDPGVYQWRIRGQNGSSKTPYTTRSFKIDTSSLASQSLSIVTPFSSKGDVIYLTNPNVRFEWRKLFGTDKYKVEVDEVSGDFSGTLLVDKLVSDLYTEFTFPDDGEYKWRVKAQNLPDQSPYSVVQKFTVDTEGPAKVSILSPLLNTRLDRPINLIWKAATSAEVVKYRVYVYRIEQTVSRDTVIMNGFPIFNPGRTNSTFLFEDTFGETGDNVVWRVTAVDQAGNESVLSTNGYFTIGN